MTTDSPPDPRTREVLVESEPFKALRPRLVDQVFASSRERRYDPNASVIRQGQLGDALFIVIDGEARVLLRERDGTVRAIGTLRRGSVLRPS